MYWYETKKVGLHGERLFNPQKAIEAMGMYETSKASEFSKLCSCKIILQRGLLVAKDTGSKKVCQGTQEKNILQKEF